MSEGKSPGSQLRHDLRTPLNQILGYTEMLQEDAEETGQDRFLPDLRRVHTAARALLALVDRIPDALPTVAAPPPAASPGPPAAPAAEGASPGVPAPVEAATLLVVDDNELNRDMLSRRLRSRGYTVLTAEDGRQALDLVAAHAFDLVLLDVMMPELSGLEVLERLRQTHSMADLPIIMATAMDQGEDIVTALGRGANDYVTKPFDFPVVLARTNTQLSLKRASEEVRRLARELEVRNRFIRQTFGRYLSAEVVAGLLETPEGLRLGGEKREVTLLMADLRGFTSVADRFPPEDVVRIVNGFLGAMTQVLNRYQGTIDEFIGDAILALFGAPISRPDDAERAAACAVAMQLAMVEVNGEFRRAGLPAFEMGIAVHTGDVIVGNLGSESRAKYGVVGSNVNLTGRIEGLTVGGQVLVSESTLGRAGSSLQVGERLPVGLKGFKEKVVVCELKGVAGTHGLRLPERRDDLLILHRPLPVEVSLLEGKQLTDVTFPATLIAVSLEAAHLKAGEAVAPLSNLRLRLKGEDGEALPGELYAKVTGAATAEGVLPLRFTSADPEATEALRRALATS